jgi:hypothetical protein
VLLAELPGLFCVFDGLLAPASGGIGVGQQIDGALAIERFANCQPMQARRMSEVQETLDLLGRPLGRFDKVPRLIVKLDGEPALGAGLIHGPGHDWVPDRKRTNITKTIVPTAVKWV